MKPQPHKGGMRHPQEDLLIVYALVLLTQEYKGREKEDWALNLAADITDQHGLRHSRPASSEAPHRGQRCSSSSTTLWNDSVRVSERSARYDSRSAGSV